MPALSPFTSCLNTKPRALPLRGGASRGRHQELVRDYGEFQTPSCSLFLSHTYSLSLHSARHGAGSFVQSPTVDLLSRQDLPRDILGHLLGALQLPPLRSEPTVSRIPALQRPEPSRGSLASRLWLQDRGARVLAGLPRADVHGW